MHAFPTLWVSFTLAASLLAQDPPASSARPAMPPAERWQQLLKQHADRLAGLRRGDAAGRARLMAARIDDLDAFAREYPGAEGQRGLVEIARMAASDPQFGERALPAIARIDPRIGEVGGIGTAVLAANKLGFAAEATRLLDGVAQRTALAERMELVQVLRQSLRDEARAAKVLADTEAMARDDEAKAEFHLAKASLLRRIDPRDRAGYLQALTASAAFAGTRSGGIAALRIAALQLAVGSAALPFAVKDTRGEEVSLDAMKGKVLVLDFWATWCSPCLADMPVLADAHRRHQARGVEVVSISVDRGEDRAKFDAAVREHRMVWRQVFEGAQWNSVVAQTYDVTTVPFTLVIGKDGKVAAKGLRGLALSEAIEKAAMAQ